MTDQFPCQYRDINSTPSLPNSFYLLFVTLLIFTCFLCAQQKTAIYYIAILSKAGWFDPINFLILIPHGAHRG